MADEFKPTSGSSISKADAEPMIQKYDDQFRADKGRDTRSLFFGRDALLKVLGENADECAGISFFLAMKFSEFAQKDVVELIMVGTKADGTLVWQESIEPQDISYAADTPCPPYCPK